MPDILSKTILFTMFSVGCVIYKEPFQLFLIWNISLIVASFLKNARPFVLIVIFVPALPVSVSHFIIEPFFTDIENLFTISNAQVSGALVGYFRVSGLSLISISWLWSSSFHEFSSLSKVIPFGRRIIISLNIIVTMILTVKQRWRAVQLIQQFHKQGSWKERRKIRLYQIPLLGLSLLIATLASLEEYSLAVKGKAFFNNSSLAVPYPKFNLYGVFCVTVSIIFIGIL